MKFKRIFRYVFLIFFFFLILNIPIIYANPVPPPLVQYGLDIGVIFLLLVIIPFTYIYASLIEFGIYYSFLNKYVFKIKDLLKLALIINFITVPLTQLIVYITGMVFNNAILLYIIIEGIVIYVEFIIFRIEIKNILKDPVIKKDILLIIVVANSMSFLLGFIFIGILFNLFSNFRYNYLIIDQITFYLIMGSVGFMVSFGLCRILNAKSS